MKEDDVKRRITLLILIVGAAILLGALLAGLSFAVQTVADARSAASGPLVSRLAPTAVPSEVSITAPSFSAAVSAGTSATASGYLQPRHSSAYRSVQLLCERLESGTWVPKATFWATNSDYLDHTRYFGDVVLSNAGSWRVRAYHIPDAEHPATYSAWTGVTVAKGAVSCSIDGSGTTGYRRPVVLTGKLRNAAGKALAGKPVTVQYAYSADASSWAGIATTSTSAGGDYFFNIVADAPTRTTYYRVWFAGDTDFTAGGSAVHRVAVLARVSPPMFWAPPYAGQPVSVSGIIDPRRPAGTRDVLLEFERSEGGTWVPKLVSETVDSDYRLWPQTASEAKSSRYFSDMIALPASGTWRVRAHLLAGTLNAETYSAWTYVSVN